MTNLNEMFATATTANVTTANARSLAGTAQLTSVAADLATKTLNAINAVLASDIPEDADKIAQLKNDMSNSMKDHDAMDALLSEFGLTAETDIQFLKDLPDTTLDSMLKSQQSKRSRSKGKVMTADNYRTLMTGAIAENLLRMAMGKEKQSGGRSAGGVGYTADELLELANDQDKLRKVLRNVQSKKSIMKSKEGFSETDERWLELINAETQLKALRSEGAPRVDKTKQALREIFELNMTSGKPFDKMNKTELVAFIESVESLCGDAPTEEDNDTDTDTEEQA